MANLGSNRVAALLLACLVMASTPALAQDAATPTDNTAIPAATSSAANAAGKDTQRKPASRSLFGKAIAELVGSMDDSPRGDADTDARNEGGHADASPQASSRAGETTASVPADRVVAQSDPR